jgi:Uri superfamily endonuclease
MKGIYILLIHLNRDIAITVGSLGTREFKESNYVYVGSAQKGVEQRVARHLKKEKRLFWHIDYLLNDGAAEIVEVYVKPASKEEECQVAAKICEKAEPVAGFGCSDCHCPSHLFRLRHSGNPSFSGPAAGSKSKKYPHQRVLSRKTLFR